MSELAGNRVPAGSARPGGDQTDQHESGCPTSTRSVHQELGDSPGADPIPIVESEIHLTDSQDGGARVGSNSELTILEQRL
jgi:hypothetical protein